MKARNFSILLIIAIFFSGCVVCSFYPLYTKKDLFPNDILTGEWVDDEGTAWNFKHAYNGKKVTDSTSYILTMNVEDYRKTVFRVHVVKLGGTYFLDFLVEELGDNDKIDLATFHIIPVHTFAKLTIKENQLQINWFDQEWLEDLIKENKIRIHHEKNDDYILLTAKPGELQKFVTKYVNSEEAFKDGMEAILKRK